MSKKILILSGSPRKGGNSDLLCDEFLKGAKEAGHEVEKIRVAEKNVGYCKACYYCVKSGGTCAANVVRSPLPQCYYCVKSGGTCAIKDDMIEILQKMIDADVLVLASPVYFYSIDAQLKAVLDRTVARWKEVENKEFYYIATCADDARKSQETTIACFRGYANCVEGAVEKGIIYGTGVYKKGEIMNSPAMKEAYEMGKSV